MSKFYLEERNFLDNPYLVRHLALARTFKMYVYTEDSIWSGYRSKIDDSESIEIRDKLEKLVGKKIKSFTSSFQLNPQSSLHGIPHKDSENPNSFAGVIYLNENAPNNCGTTLYEDCTLEVFQNFVDNDKLEILYSAALNEDNRFKKQFSKECLDFKENVLKKIISFEFEFNKLVCYSGDYLHSPDFYFGKHLYDGRMTIAFHGEFDAV